MHRVVSVSGSFHRHLLYIKKVVDEFLFLGAQVLSPVAPVVFIDNIDDFIFIESDKIKAVKITQDNHFNAITRSDILFIVSPDGYIGQSTTLEIGFAIAYKIPIYSTYKFTDIVLSQYIKHVNSIKEIYNNTCE